MGALKPKHYEWEPKDVPDNAVWEILANLDRKPEELPDKKDQDQYRAYLKKHSKK